MMRLIRTLAEFRFTLSTGQLAGGASATPRHLAKFLADALYFASFLKYRRFT